MNVRTTAAGLAFLTALLLGQGAGADEWDAATADDDGTGTSNVLVHGSAQVHDVQAVGGTADQDWYRVLVRPMSSYQMVIDGQTSELNLEVDDFQRLTEFGTPLQSTSTPDDSGLVLDLSWRHGTNPAATQLVRVRNAACGTACECNVRYRIRFYETTYTVPRFNNTATQTTLLVLHNRSIRSCVADIYLLGGSTVVQTGAALSAGETAVINTATDAPNQSGAVRVAHDCGYGTLAGKAVAVEPATGFTFDTLMQHRAN
jgi:hypothetical protein